MTNDEAAAVLLRASGVDGRKAGELQARMWGHLLRDVDAADAMDAVDEHYATSDKWLMPVHVIEGAKRIRRRRDGQARLAELEAQIEAENAGELHARPVAALAVGRSVPVDDPVRVERRRMLRTTARQSRVEADTQAKADRDARLAAARAELARLSPATRPEATDG